MSRITRNIQIILRSERLMARRRAALAGRKLGLLGAAALLAAGALVFLNLAAYLALAARMDPALAALCLAGADILLAAILVAAGLSLSAEHEIAPVADLRDLAVADLEGELQQATEEARELSRNVRRIAHDPLGTAGFGLLAPLLGLILKNLRTDPAENDRVEAPEE